MKRSKGLGDSIEKFTKATGIKSLTELASRKITGKPGGCGCNKRKNWLNQAFPYKQYGK